MKLRITALLAVTATALLVAAGSATASHETPNVADQYGDPVPFVEASPQNRKIKIPIALRNGLTQGGTLGIAQVKKVVKSATITLVDANGAKCALKHGENIRVKLVWRKKKHRQANDPKYIRYLRITVIKPKCSPGWNNNGKPFDLRSAKMYAISGVSV